MKIHMKDHFEIDSDRLARIMPKDRALCNPLNTKSIDFKITKDKLKVTCKNCLRIMAKEHYNG